MFLRVDSSTCVVVVVTGFCSFLLCIFCLINVVRLRRNNKWWWWW